METSTSLTDWSHTTLSLTASIARRFGYGPQDDTWQRPYSLPLHELRSVFRKRKGGIPEEVVDALPEHLRNAARH